MDKLNCEIGQVDARMSNAQNKINGILKKQVNIGQDVSQRNMGSLNKQPS